MTEFKILKNKEEIDEACAYLKQQPFVGLDTETTALNPYDGKLRLIQFSDGVRTYVIDTWQFFLSELGSVVELIEAKSPVKVIHNAKFDAKWLKLHLGAEVGPLFDTYLASMIIEAGDQSKVHKLGAVTDKYLRIKLDKSEQVSDWSAPVLSAEQVEYAAKDASILVPLMLEMQDVLNQQHLAEVAQLEFDCVMPVAQMELNGIFMDSQMWQGMLDLAVRQRAEAADDLQRAFASGMEQSTLFGVAGVNLDSQAHVRAGLEGLGVPVPKSTREYMLQPLVEKYPIVERVLDYRGLTKLVTDYGAGMFDFINPITKRIHADFFQIGAPTGRFSCSKPNLQKIPKEAGYRNCFKPGSGRVFVIADYSQIELRIIADFSQDVGLIDSFCSGVDFHTMTASQVFNTPFEDVDEEQRFFAKRLNFGVVYGIGPQRFSMTAGVTVEKAEDIIKKYFRTYSRLDKYLYQSGNDCITLRNSRTASGRMLKLRFNPYDKKEKSQARRNGNNMPIQGTSADILKRALRLLHNEIRGTSAKLVNIVHDEIVVECDRKDAEVTAVTLENAMREAGERYIRSVPIKVEAKITDSWKK